MPDLAQTTPGSRLPSEPDAEGYHWFADPSGESMPVCICWEKGSGWQEPANNPFWGGGAPSLSEIAKRWKYAGPVFNTEKRL